MESKITFFEHILGTTDIVMFASMFFLALIGAFVSLLLHANNRNNDGTSVQTQFSWSVLIRNNIQRIVLSLLLIFLALRFCKDLIGLDLSPLKATGIGFSFDKLGQLLKKLNILDRFSAPTPDADTAIKEAAIQKDIVGDHPKQGPK